MTTSSLEGTPTAQEIRDLRIDLGLREGRMADILGIQLSDQVLVERRGPDRAYLVKLRDAYRAGDLPSVQAVTLIQKIEPWLNSTQPTFTATKARIRKARLLLGLSQANLAHMLGMTGPAVCYAEKGYTRSLDYLVQGLGALLVERLKIEGDLNQFLDRSNPTPLKPGPKPCNTPPVPDSAT